MQETTQGLPVEMQERIAQIVANAKAEAKPEPEAKPEAKTPGWITEELRDEATTEEQQKDLMDHVISLRLELDAMRQELHAVAQVTDAVGQAVGRLFAAYHMSQDKE